MLSECWEIFSLNTRSVPLPLKRGGAHGEGCIFEGLGDVGEGGVGVRGECEGDEEVREVEDVFWGTVWGTTFYAYIFRHKYCL